MNEPNKPRKFTFDENGLHETVNQISDSYISGYMQDADTGASDPGSMETLEG
ncbi:hypothetical protein [Peribacillus sp. SCS-155]|uniref:hypothetical protein n=1 Tax=Peribacillus sedimenti TaxID=3115297 RepID=UPI00390644F6